MDAKLFMLRENLKEFKSKVEKVPNSSDQAFYRAFVEIMDNFIEIEALKTDSYYIRV
ncbi:hypothetical protein M0R19_05220 [Candidatus Pacearchaeota archaeon]|jgi:hypothetical protein|nr:hypothetical protein [Candidatus Pacearchaeota archaeon]